MKPAYIVLLALYWADCQTVTADDTTAPAEVAQSLHSQIKYIESEILRVWITIDALVDEISENSDALTEEMHKSLANLYYYDSQLGAYLGEVQNELSRLDDPSSTVFTNAQFAPIKSSTMVYTIPPDALPILDGSKIVIK